MSKDKLSVAYNVARRSKMSSGGAVKPPGESMDLEFAKHLARSVMAKHMGSDSFSMEDGGSGMDEMAQISESGDDMFSMPESGPMGSPGQEGGDAMEEENDPQKGILSQVMRRRR